MARSVADRLAALEARFLRGPQMAERARLLSARLASALDEMDVMTVGAVVGPTDVHELHEHMRFLFDLSPLPPLPAI